MAADPAPEGGGAWRAATDPLARTVFALLVVACFAAFFVTQRLKHTPTTVQHFEGPRTFSPGSSDPEARQERLSFKLSRADEVTVTIIDADGNTVATLVRDYPVARYKQFSLRWNGRRGFPRGFVGLKSPTGRQILLPRNTGPLAPAGEYRVRVVLRGQGRELLLPRSFRLVPR